MILLNSNVLIAALIETHPHHDEPNAVAEAATLQSTLVAAHGLAETYSTITRLNLPYRVSGAVAAGIIERRAERMTITALTAPQTINALRRFGALGTGPRLYDFLIGVTGETYGVDTIMTWIIRDFDGLFPSLRVTTPADFALA